MDNNSTEAIQIAIIYTELGQDILKVAIFAIFIIFMSYALKYT